MSNWDIRHYKHALVDMGFGEAGWENLFIFDGMIIGGPYWFNGGGIWTGKYGVELGSGIREAYLELLEPDTFFEQLQVALSRVERRTGGDRIVRGMGRFLPCGFRLWRDTSVMNVLNIDVANRRAGFLLNLSGLYLVRK